MSDLLGITVSDLVALLRERGKRVPFEVGAFITLQAVERVLDRPSDLGPESVRVSEDGTVSVFSAPGAITSAEATRSASSLLAHLLVGAGSAVPAQLLDLVEHGPSDGSGRISRFRDELEASLLPLNRGASQRTLARLVRESRVDTGASRATSPDPASLDEDLDALLSGDGGPSGAPAYGARVSAPLAPEPRVASTRDAPRPQAAPSERRGSPLGSPFPEPWSLDAGVGDAQAPTFPAAERPRDTPLPPAPSYEPPPSRPRVAPPPDEDEDELIGKSRSASRPTLVVSLAFVGLVVATLALVAVVRPDVLRRMMGDAPPPRDHAAEEAAARSAAAKRAEDEARERYGDLVLRVEPPRSQVLMRVGRGPAVATNLPIGVAHEFIALADGRAPTRAVVPADASWESTEQGPRYELAMQAGEAPMAFEDLDLGDTRLPSEVGAPSGRVGAVRVVTNPPGAEVYLLIGFAPEVVVRDLRADQAYELLVFRDGHAATRVTVPPERFVPGEDGKVAEVEITLEPRRRSRRSRR